MSRSDLARPWRDVRSKGAYREVRVALPGPDISDGAGSRTDPVTVGKRLVAPETAAFTSVTDATKNE